MSTNRTELELEPGGLVNSFQNLHLVLTYYQMMEIVLKCKKRYRPILSLPYAFGTLQGLLMEKLPENIFTLSRDQVKQLKLDNVVRLRQPSFKDLVEGYTGRKLGSVHDILPTYL